ARCRAKARSPRSLLKTRRLSVPRGGCPHRQASAFAQLGAGLRCGRGEQPKLTHYPYSLRQRSPASTTSLRCSSLIGHFSVFSTPLSSRTSTRVSPSRLQRPLTGPSRSLTKPRALPDSRRL